MDSFDVIFHGAARILERRMHSSDELRRKLRQRYPKNRKVIDSVIEELQRARLLNDDAYADMAVSHFMEKPIGLQKIIRQTAAKGISAATVKRLLEEKNWDEKKNLERAYAAKARSLHKLPRQKRFNRLFLFLKGRGFPESIVYRFLDQKKKFDFPDAP